MNKYFFFVTPRITQLFAHQSINQLHKTAGWVKKRFFTLFYLGKENCQRNSGKAWPPIHTSNYYYIVRSTVTFFAQLVFLRRCSNLHFTKPSPKHAQHWLLRASRFLLFLCSSLRKNCDEFFTTKLLFITSIFVYPKLTRFYTYIVRYMSWLFGEVW